MQKFEQKLPGSSTLCTCLKISFFLLPITAAINKAYIMDRPFIRPSNSTFGSILSSRDSVQNQFRKYWDLFAEKDGTKKAVILFVEFDLTRNNNCDLLAFKIAYIAQLKQSLDENEGFTRRSLDVMDAKLKSADEQL